jgi:thiamine-phosphate pyrophosphorylase
VIARPTICLVTDRRRLPGDADPGAAGAGGAGEPLVRLVGHAAEAGVDLIQLREPDLEGAALGALVERCLRAVEGSGTRIVVNDRIDVAMATGAAGVHLTARSVPAARVRSVVSASFLLGRSVHGADEAAAAVAAGGLDYLVFGTVFDTASKPGCRPAGIEQLRRAVVSAGAIPVLAIGGVSTRNAALVASTGAAGIAAIGAFLPGAACGPMRQIVGELRAAFDARGITQ